MNKAIQQAYYMKMVYHNAGKTLMAENYKSYENLVNRQCVKNISDIVTAGTVSFSDLAGCAENELFLCTAEKHRNKSNVFLYYDDLSADEKLMAVYITENGIFLFSDYEYKFRNIKNIKLNRCYYRQDKGKIYAKKLHSIAREYFEKSECIAKGRCL